MLVSIVSLYQLSFFHVFLLDVNADDLPCKDNRGVQPEGVSC